MCVALFDALKHLLLRKTDALKTCRKSKFRENVYSGKRLSSAVFRLQNCVSDFF